MSQPTEAGSAARITGLMDDILQLPPRKREPAVPREVEAFAPIDVSVRLRDAWARMTAADRAADAVVAAALDGAHAGDDAVERFADRVGRRIAQARPAEASFEAALYDCAAEAVAADQTAEAWVGLVILLDARGLRSLAMIGLAVCAARLGHVQEALALSLGSRSSDPSHPRALLIAGYSESRQGHLGRARRYFAIASRLARHQPDHAAEFRMAQRLLLTLQVV